MTRRDTVQAASDGPDAGRRALLKGTVAGAGAVWVVPTIDSFVSPAAAASGEASVTLWKDDNGTLAGRCLGCNGNCSNASRGSVTFTRSEGPASICVEITLSTGTNITGRDIYISMSDGTQCISQVKVGDWAASPQQGPQSFCTAIASGATWFSVHMPVSGGGGNDIYTSDAVNLP